MKYYEIIYIQISRYIHIYMHELMRSETLKNESIITTVHVQGKT